VDAPESAVPPCGPGCDDDDAGEQECQPDEEVPEGTAVGGPRSASTSAGIALMDRRRVRALLALGPNVFGETAGPMAGVRSPMEDATESILAETGAPTDAPVETLDVAAAGPPAPLRQTLELLPDLDDDVVLVQYNDRAPSTSIRSSTTAGTPTKRSNRRTRP